MRSTLGIDLEFIGHDFISDRPSLPIRKRPNVNEDLISAPVWVYESKALVIFPVCYFSLIAHIHFRKS
ncbi:hypothetical protein NSMM_90004 [Nitrosomonas mobilis]|uniref:Uncharacterized protein n=1 Tax=Nitrosomonas mobilis TaxID=51642 RepID=A0A1G5SJ65_9PROT|nr:hypothetical protein NSMM_90004 [Nitrosomonas mobilis]